MAAYAALLSLINNIDQIMKHPRLSTSLDNKHIHPLLQKAGFLLDFMEANNYGAGSKEAEDLEREIASAAHAAEDVIESHIVDQIHAGTSETSLQCSLDLQQKTQDMDAVMKKADEFKGKHGSREEQPTHATPAVEIGETTAMVGLDAELYQLLDQLTGRESSQHTISIVGMGGTGKTTLAKNIFQHPLIKEHFDCRAWATISKQHNAKKILSQLLSGLGKYSHGDVGDLRLDLDEGDLQLDLDVGDLQLDVGDLRLDLDVGDLQLDLHQHLTGRRYLIILDDIWSVDAWNEVRLFFPDNNNGSRVVLTTRLSNLANDCGSSPLMMKFLDEDKSWELFCEKAFKKNEPCPPELREVGEEIVKLCRGLALSIVVMGGLLSKSPRTVDCWRGVVRDMRSISDSKEKEESLDVLSLSYTHLPPHLKPCFLYMGIFEEDSEIFVSNVVKLWVAEGFIKPIGCQVLEEIAEGYLQNLIDRNLILVLRRRKNGKIRCCGIHDLLRDLCLKLAKQQQFFGVDEDIQDNERRVVFDFLSSYEPGIPLARSIIARFRVLQKPESRLLRIWGHEGNIDNSAAELYDSVNLRYLAYTHPFHPSCTWKLPISVSLIWNLQTLIIDDVTSSLVVVAPTEIWKMRQLRHVKCNKIYVPPRVGQDELLIMDNLQTLTTVEDFRLSEEVCKIIPNIKKLHLRCSCAKHRRDDCVAKHMCNLDRLHKLETLIIGPSKLWLDETSTDVLIINSKICRFPSSLKKLSLRSCRLEWEDVTLIGSLPQLEVLVLRDHSAFGREWSPVYGEFQQLKYLQIHSSCLKYWNADSYHFPVLEKLVLVECRRLREIPLDIGEIPTLQLIRLENSRLENSCRIEAAVSAVKIKEAQLENMGNDSLLEVQISIHDSQVASLKEMVSVNNIQLIRFN